MSIEEGRAGRGLLVAGPPSDEELPPSVDQSLRELLFDSLAYRAGSRAERKEVLGVNVARLANMNVARLANADYTCEHFSTCECSAASERGLLIPVPPPNSSQEND